MRKTSRPPAAMAVLSTMALLGCAHGGAGPAPAPVAYSVKTPLQVIAADPKGMAVLVQDVPGVMFSSKYPLIEEMSLSEVASLSGGGIPQAKLDQVQGDLDKLNAQEAAARQAALAAQTKPASKPPAKPAPKPAPPPGAP